MTGIKTNNRRALPLTLIVVSAMSLAACDENGEFAFPTADSATDAGTSGAPARRAIITETANDVERPDIFDITDRGLWDGRPSLGGVWVAHPDVSDPERVIIRNPDNGRSVVGALFRRERENPGPLLQVSSDAAEELGLLAGAPTELSVIALRRDETEPEEQEAAPEENPVVASLAAPVGVESAPLDPVAGAAAAAIVAAEGGAEAAVDAAEGGAEAAVAVVLPPADTQGAADASEEALVETPVDVSAVLADLPPATGAGEADLTGPQLQIGVFSVEANANDGAQRLREAGVPASVVVQQAGGRDVWRLVAAPVDADTDATLAQIKGLGFVDVFLVGDTAEQEG